MSSQRLFVCGTSFRRIGFGRMAGFVLGPEDDAGREELKLRLGAEEIVYLATCNRVEVYVLLPEGVTPDPTALGFQAACFFAERGAVVGSDDLFARVGEEALRHLFRVAASLDSLVVGETEIAGQLRRARDADLKAGRCGKALNKLVDTAIATSRKVRARTGVGDTHCSVATIALQKIRKHFGPQGPGVAVAVGVGDMSRKVAQALKTTPSKLLVVNRTRERAEAFCGEHGGLPRSLAEFQSNPPGWIDLLFTATAAEEPVVCPAHLAPALAARRAAGVTRPLIVVDLGLPRDVDPAVDALPGVLVVSMAQLEALSAERQQRLEVEARAAEELVQAAVSSLRREERFRSLAGESAQALLASRLSHLDAQDAETIRRYAEGLAGRMARQPVERAG
jgi:glutamyl-tRNA reductase